MPQLFSRMDDLNWLTPAIADILDQGASPPTGDGSMRDMIKQLQDEFAQQEAPVKVVDVRPSPSYTLFILQPEMIGRLGNRRIITPNEIRRSLNHIAEKHKSWRLGFLAQVEDFPDHVGLLVRTDKHRPLSLRRLLVRGTYREHTSTLAFTLGNTLDQQLIVHDLTQTPHLVVQGESHARHHLISSIVLTLTLLNTPQEIRFIFAGSGTESYSELAELPHLLNPGQRITTGEALVKALTQLTQEAQTRLEQFYAQEINHFDDYNARMRDQGKPTLSRIVLTLDALSDEAFQPVHAQLTPILRDLLVNGEQVGIHIIFAVTQTIPRSLSGLLPVQIIMRSAAPDLTEKIKNWHSSLLRFVDAFIYEGNTITPVELCAVTSQELQSAVNYWQGISAQHIQDPNEAAQVPALHPQALQERATMLAAYLGWLSIGALQDIFGISAEDANETVQKLKAAGVIETHGGAMLRFIRLADAPNSDAAASLSL